MGPGVRIKCLDSLLHNGSICRKNGSPFLSLMGISHIASVCLLQGKRKSGWFKHKEDPVNKNSENAEQNQNRFKDHGHWQNFEARVQMTYSQEVFWRWVQSDLCNSVQVPASIRQKKWTGSSARRILENIFFSQFISISPFIVPNAS